MHSSMADKQSSMCDLPQRLPDSLWVRKVGYWVQKEDFIIKCKKMVRLIDWEVREELQGRNWKVERDQRTNWKTREIDAVGEREEQENLTDDGTSKNLWKIHW